MEGYIPNNRVDHFKDRLKEGSVYTMEQFVLSDAKKNIQNSGPSIQNEIYAAYTNDRNISSSG